MTSRMFHGFAQRKAGVALWIALMMPGLVMALALGLEVAHWSAVQVQLQRAADVAAAAGAINYKATSNAQTAATAAARMAQLNGVVGMTSPTWNATSKTLSDNMVSAQVTSGAKSSSNTAVQVTVQKTVPLAVAQLVNSATSVTLSATSMAELITSTSGGGGGQPCLVALSTSGYISGAGSTYITMPNCTMRSNGTITVTGGGNLSTAGIYAAGTIAIDTWIPTTGSKVSPAGTIADPYASNTALQNALTSAAALTGVSNVSCNNSGCSPALPNGSSCSKSGSSYSCTLYPGNYGGISFGSGPGTITFSPGLFLIKGNVSFSGNMTVAGSNVTIVTTGSFTGQNTFNFTASAPSSTAAASTGGIAGVVLAGSTTSNVTVSGSDNVSITGIIYFPNALFDASGSSGLGISAINCLEIVAASIKVSGSSYFNSSCSSVNATTFGSLPGTTTTTASLVQ